MSLPSIFESYQAHVAAGNPPESYQRPAPSPSLLREQYVLPRSPSEAETVLTHTSLVYRQLAANLYTRLRRSNDQVSTLCQQLKAYKNTYWAPNAFVIPIFCGSAVTTAVHCYRHIPTVQQHATAENAWLVASVSLAFEFLTGTRFIRTILWILLKSFIFAIILAEVELRFYDAWGAKFPTEEKDAREWLSTVERWLYERYMYSDEWQRNRWFAQYLLFLVMAELYIRNSVTRRVGKELARSEQRGERESNTSRLASTDFLEDYEVENR